MGSKPKYTFIQRIHTDQNQIYEFSPHWSEWLSSESL